MCAASAAASVAAPPAARSPASDHQQAAAAAAAPAPDGRFPASSPPCPPYKKNRPVYTCFWNSNIQGRMPPAPPSIRSERGVIYRPTRDFGGQTGSTYRVDMLRRMRPEGSDIPGEPGIIETLIRSQQATWCIHWLRMRAVSSTLNFQVWYVYHKTFDRLAKILPLAYASGI